VWVAEMPVSGRGLSLLHPLPSVDMR